MAKADHHRIPKIIPPADIEESYRPAYDKNDDGGYHDRKDESCFVFHACLGAFAFAVPRNNQNCLASSTACLFPASIMSTARPSQLCSTVSDTTLRTPMNRSQNST